LTANDFDAQAEDLTVTEVGKAFGGTVLLTNDTITFTPDNNFSGLAQFDYTASDEDGDTDTATVTIDVRPPNPELFGTPGDDVLDGSSVDNIFHGSAGNDTMTGGGGRDFYTFDSNVGQTVINNLAQDGFDAARGQIQFSDAGISSANLWLEQKGNDLQIDLMGTQGHITVAGWYGSDPRARVESINLASGQRADTIDSGLQQLVSAMAAYSDAHPGFNPTTSAQAPNDPGLQNAIANAWH
jgi:serralysin